MFNIISLTHSLHIDYVQGIKYLKIKKGQKQKQKELSPKMYKLLTKVENIIEISLNRKKRHEKQRMRKS